MEKHIASHDLSDMMVHEGIQALSLKFYPKQKFIHLKKIIERGFTAVELFFRLVKKTVRAKQRSFRYFTYVPFNSTAAAFYTISVATAVISFFWFMLLLSV